MSERQPITEDSGVHEAWYEEAKKQTVETLPAFLRHLTQDYTHDYGTICHAAAAAAIGAAHAVDHEPTQGGITGFQAGAIMWEFIQRWGHREPPLALLEFDDMLYPQHEERFSTIKRSVADHLKAEARKRLDANGDSMHPAVKAHMLRVAEGHIPFGWTVRDE